MICSELSIQRLSWIRAGSATGRLLLVIPTFRTPLLTATFVALLAGCAVGPDYVRPAMDIPSAYKEAGSRQMGTSSGGMAASSGTMTPGPWKVAEPRQIDSQHNWWDAYGDSTLSALIEQANDANQDIRQAEAQYRQAVAVAAAARAGFWPTAGVSAGVGRSLTNVNTIKLGNEYSIGLDAAWEPDLWGSVRRSVEAGEAGSQASAADLAAARLSIQATLAQDYFQLRITDLLVDMYARTIAAYERALKLAQNQYAAGVVLRSDVALAQSQLSATQAQAIDLQAQRSQLEHAIAILCGKAPATFSIAVVSTEVQVSVQTHTRQSAIAGASNSSMPRQQDIAQATIKQSASRLDSSSLMRLPMHLPNTPAGLPSDLLERRPDIASAERHVATANANIGVTRAAYFPALLLNASGGFNAGTFAEWFNVPSRVWALGATLAQTLFDGGLRRAHSDQAIAAYDAAVAQYKQTVLNGFREVEDNLATLRILEQEAVAQTQAAQAGQLAEQLALAQYRGGTVTYLNVITAQTLSLTNERALVQLQGRQLVASVALIKAVGGGWDVTQLTQSAPSTPKIQ